MDKMKFKIPKEGPDYEYDRLFWQDGIPPHEYVKAIIEWGKDWKAEAIKLLLKKEEKSKLQH
jgi:hypothetical protein